MELKHYINVITPTTEILITDSDSIIIYHGRLGDLSGCIENRIVLAIQLSIWHITGNTVMHIIVE